MKAWLLWNKGEASKFMDVCFTGSGVEAQVLRCIHVGLLCVHQKHSEDRPTMNSVVLMLSNEEAKLPQPKMPGFFLLKEVQTTVKSVQRREMRNCIQRTKWRSRLKVDRLDIVKCWLDCEAWSMTCQSQNGYE